MPLFLSEKHVAELLTMPETLQLMESAFRHWAEGCATLQPRRRLHMPRGIYHFMAAADLTEEIFGIKLYASFRPKTRFLVLLYSAQNGDLLALMEADMLGQMRTGAVSGLATRILANKHTPMHVGIIGTGWQAESQLEAVCTACSVDGLLAYSRTPERCQAFCSKMTSLLPVPVLPKESPEALVKECNVIITATSASQPVLHGSWLNPGTHINAIGSNMLIRQEIDIEVVQRANLVVMDSIEQAKLEAGDLLPAVERGVFRWEQAVELAQVVGGNHPGRKDQKEITLFKSLGIALEDVVVAFHLYQKARNLGVGEERELGEL